MKKKKEVCTLHPKVNKKVVVVAAVVVVAVAKVVAGREAAEKRIEIERSVEEKTDVAGKAAEKKIFRKTVTEQKAAVLVEEEE